MIDPPKSRAEAEMLTYGHFQKTPYDPKHCCFSVWDSTMGFGRSYQCTRKPGFGPDKLYCKQHDPAAQEARDKKREEKWKLKDRAERPKWYAYEMLALLKESQSMAIDGGSWRKRRDALIKQIEND